MFYLLDVVVHVLELGVQTLEAHHLVRHLLRKRAHGRVLKVIKINLSLIFQLRNSEKVRTTELLTFVKNKIFLEFRIKKFGDNLSRFDNRYVGSGGITTLKVNTLLTTCIQKCFMSRSFETKTS